MPDTSGIGRSTSPTRPQPSTPRDTRAPSTNTAAQPRSTTMDPAQRPPSRESGARSRAASPDGRRNAVLPEPGVRGRQAAPATATAAGAGPASPAETRAAVRADMLVAGGAVRSKEEASARLARMNLQRPLASMEECNALLDRLMEMALDGKLDGGTHIELANALMRHALEPRLPTETDEHGPVPAACLKVAKDAVNEAMDRGDDAATAILAGCKRYEATVGHRLLDPQAMFDLGECARAHADTLTLAMPSDRLLSAAMTMRKEIESGRNLQEALQATCARFRQDFGVALTDPMGVGGLIALGREVAQARAAPRLAPGELEAAQKAVKDAVAAGADRETALERGRSAAPGLQNAADAASLEKTYEALAVCADPMHEFAQHPQAVEATDAAMKAAIQAGATRQEAIEAGKAAFAKAAGTPLRHPASIELLARGYREDVPEIAMANAMSITEQKMRAGVDLGTAFTGAWATTQGRFGRVLKVEDYETLRQHAAAVHARLAGAVSGTGGGAGA